MSIEVMCAPGLLLGQGERLCAYAAPCFQNTTAVGIQSVAMQKLEQGSRLVVESLALAVVVSVDVHVRHGAKLSPDLLRDLSLE